MGTSTAGVQNPQGELKEDKVTVIGFGLWVVVGVASYVRVAICFQVSDWRMRTISGGN